MPDQIRIFTSINQLPYPSVGKPDVVDRHRADPDPTLHFDADPDPIPDSTPSFTHIKRKLWFFYSEHDADSTGSGF
jgi:hypothetical protein